MKYFITIILITFFSANILFAQSSTTELRKNITKEYSTEDISKFISLGRSLPTDVPVPNLKCKKWKEEKMACTEIYILWYERMLELGFDINDTERVYAFDPNQGISMEEPKQQSKEERMNNIKIMNKNKARVAFEQASLRLNRFIKSSFKGNPKNFQQYIQSYSEIYDRTVVTINKEVLKISTN